MKQKQKCFFWLTALLLFCVVVSGGCGGGSGGSMQVGRPNDENTLPDTPNLPKSNDIPSPSPTPKPTPVSPDIPVPVPVPVSPDAVSFIVSFIDIDGSEIERQIVSEEAKAVEPEAPEKEGYVFLGWLDADGYLYDFDSPVYEDIALAADYSELEKATQKELLALSQSADIEGENSVSFDEGSPLLSVSVSADLDGAGTVTLSIVSHEPMSETAGLIGNPVSIHNVGGDVKKTAITFAYDPELVRQSAVKMCEDYKKLSVDIDSNAVDLNNIAVVWYDESNDIMTLLENSKVDTAAHTVTAETTHFSKYGVVIRGIWDAVWDAKLPAARTEAKPYYDIVLAVECTNIGIDEESNEMSSLIPQLQDFVDALTDDDRIIIYGVYDPHLFGDCGYKVNVLSEKMKLSSEGKDNRPEIKNKIAAVLGGTLYDLFKSRNWYEASRISEINPNYEFVSGSNYSGGNMGLAFTIASDLKTDDSMYQPLVLYVASVVHTEYVYTPVLNKLKDNGQRAIIFDSSESGNGKNIMEVVNKTGGKYYWIFPYSPYEPDNIFASYLKNAFLDLQTTYIGYSKDTDGDKLPDMLEYAGMRDQYGKIWRTNQNMRDSDSDGSDDNTEMGKYQSFTEHPYFKRVSNPLKTTRKFSEPKIVLPQRMYYDLNEGTNTISVWVETLNYSYEEIGSLEYVYTPAKKVKVELAEVPEPFKLVSTETKEYDDGQGALRYVTTAVLSYPETAKLNNLKWKVTADNQSWTVTSNGVQVDYEVRQVLLTDAKSCMEQLETSFIEQLCGDAENTKSGKTQSLQDLKKQITAHQTSFSLRSEYKASDLPDEIYESFARAVLDTLANSNIDKFEFDIDKPAKLPEQIYDQIAKGINSDSFSVNLNGKTYDVRYSITALSFMKWGGGYAEATVSWKESYGTETWQLVWTSSYKAGINALSHYCAVLAQLELDVWNDFLATCVKDMFSIKKDKTKKVLTKTENVIKAMCGDADAAKEVAKDIKASGKEKVKSLIEEGFKKFILKFFPNGQKLIDVAQKIDKASKKRDALEKALGEYDTAKNKKEADEKISYAYKQFKTEYNKLGEIDLFNGKFPKLPTYEQLYGVPRIIE